MRVPVYTNRFEKDLKQMMRRGRNPAKLKSIVRKILAGEVLDQKYREHMLAGNFKDRRECHIEPDWLLIYQILGERVIFERTGTHSDLFE